jgi:hypothetical protein
MSTPPHFASTTVHTSSLSHDFRDAHRRSLSEAFRRGLPGITHHRRQRRQSEGVLNACQLLVLAVPKSSVNRNFPAASSAAMAF